jgi:hypothetical protein
MPPYYNQNLLDSEIIAIIDRHNPDLAKICNNPTETGIIIRTEKYLQHNHPEEFLLLGLAIKYVQLKKKNLTLITSKKTLI